MLHYYSLAAGWVFFLYRREPWPRSFRSSICHAIARRDAICISCLFNFNGLFFLFLFCILFECRKKKKKYLLVQRHLLLKFFFSFSPKTWSWWHFRLPPAFFWVGLWWTLTLATGHCYYSWRCRGKRTNGEEELVPGAGRCVELIHQGSGRFVRLDLKPPQTLCVTTCFYTVWGVSRTARWIIQPRPTMWIQLTLFCVCVCAACILCWNWRSRWRNNCPPSSPPLFCLWLSNRKKKPNDFDLFRRAARDILSLNFDTKWH